MIRGERTNLRAIERSDAADLFRWFNDPDLMHFWGLGDPVVSLTEVQRRIEDWLDDERTLRRPAALVVETLDGESVGLVILGSYRPEHRSTELSLLIGERERWGQGLGTDALRAVIDACFLTWQMHRLWLRSEAFNERAQRLFRRCGFVQEATLRDATFLDGQYFDQYVFALLNQTDAAIGTG